MKKILSFFFGVLAVFIPLCFAYYFIVWSDKKIDQHFNKGPVFVTSDEVITKGEFLGRVSSRLRTEDYNTNFLVRYKGTLFDCLFQRQDNGNANDLYGCKKL